MRFIIRFNEHANNCRNLARSISLSWRAISESPKRLSGTGWRLGPKGLRRVRTRYSEHRVRRVRLLFRLPLSRRFRASFLSFSDQNPVPRPLYSARGGKRDVRLGSANLRETSMPELVHGTEHGRDGGGFIVIAGRSSQARWSVSPKRGLATALSPAPPEEKSFIKRG